MIYTIKRINNKRAIPISLSLIVILVFSMLLISISTGYFNVVLIIIGFLFSLLISLMIGVILSQKILIVKLDNDKIEFEDKKIPLPEISGFYINKKSPIMTQIELRTISNDIELTAHNFGKSGKIFNSFISELLEKAANTNLNIIELSYYDFHPTQRKFARVFISTLIVLAVIINLVYLYLILFKGVKFVWQIFLFDLLFATIFANHRNYKSKAKK